MPTLEQTLARARKAVTVSRRLIAQTRALCRQSRRLGNQRWRIWSQPATVIKLAPSRVASPVAKPVAEPDPNAGQTWRKYSGCDPVTGATTFTFYVIIG